MILSRVTGEMTFFMVVMEVILPFLVPQQIKLILELLSVKILEMVMIP